MKILVKEGKYRKVSNDWIADNLVKTMGWAYSTRSEWKKNDRDVKKITTQVAEETKNILEKNSKHLETKLRRAKNHTKIVKKQTHQ